MRDRRHDHRALRSRPVEIDGCYSDRCCSVGASADEAIAASRAAQIASFTWDSARASLPNRRMLRVGSEAIYGDARLVAAAIAASISE